MKNMERSVVEKVIVRNMVANPDLPELVDLSPDNFTHPTWKALFRSYVDTGRWMPEGYSTSQDIDDDLSDSIRRVCAGWAEDPERFSDDAGTVPEYVEYLKSLPLDEKEEDETEDDKVLGRLYGYLEKNKGRSVGRHEIAEYFKVSPQAVSKWIKKDAEGDCLLRVTRVGKRKFLAMRSEKGFRKAKQQFEKVNVLGALPGGMSDYFGSRFGGELKRETFFGVIGFTDFGKTQFLLNLAIHFALQGKKVAYVRHEDDDLDFYLDVGRRLLGANVMDTEPVFGAMRETGIDHNLEAYVAPEEANLDEFCETIVDEIKPDVVVYDYLSQELVDIDIPEQRSVIAAIVNKLADNVCRKGIALFTAVQLESRNGEFKINPKWLRRMNIALWIRTTRIDEHRYQLLCDVVKNKQGGVRGGQFLELTCDAKTWQFDQCLLVDRKEIGERWGDRVAKSL